MRGSCGTRIAAVNLVEFASKAGAFGSLHSIGHKAADEDPHATDRHRGCCGSNRLASPAVPLRSRARRPRRAHALDQAWRRRRSGRDLCLGARPLRRSQGEMTGARRMKQTPVILAAATVPRSEEHTSELQSLMRISYAVFCLNKKIAQK